MKFKIQWNSVLKGTTALCAIVVTALVVPALFSWMNSHGNVNLDYVDFKVDELKSSLVQKIENLESEIGELRQLVKQPKKPNTVKLPEPAEQSVYADSVPCCGGEDNLTNIGDPVAVSEFESFEESFERELQSLPEESQTSIQDMMQQMADFKDQLDEEGLAELEQRKEEEKALMKEQWIALINASTMSVAEKQKALRNIGNANPALEMMVDMFVTAEMEVEEKIAEEINSPSIADSLSRLGVKEGIIDNTTQITEEEWKMQEALRMLEEAARQQE